MTRVPRRAFLWQALAACGTACVPRARPAEAPRVPRTDRAAGAGVAYFGDQADIVRSIGEAYVRQVRGDTSRESVLTATRGTINVITRSVDEPAAIRALERTVREDFRRGRTVQVEGWILSRTEADVCALMLLSGSTTNPRR